MLDKEIDIVNSFLVNIIQGDFNADITEDFEKALNAGVAFQTIVNFIKNTDGFNTRLRSLLQVDELKDDNE